MLIHIINGTYGYREKDKDGKLSDYVKSATRFDPPIDVDEEEAAWLVENHIAEYADAGPAGVAADVPETNPADENASEPEGGETPIESGENENDDLTDDEDVLTFTTAMKADELRAAMRERNLPMRPGMTKQEMVDALNGTDDFPDLNPQEVIEE